MLWSDFTQLSSEILLIVGALLPVVNPLGDAPFFLAMTEGCDQATRMDLARRITIYSFGLLLGSMLLGSFVLRLFGLSIPIVQVAGGAVVCSIGWNLMTGDTSDSAPAPIDADHARRVALGRAFYPLTLPVTIDGGVISVAITLGANHAHTFTRTLIQLVAAVIGCGLAAVTVLLAYRYAAPFSRRLGNTGMMVVLRLSAFIAVCIGVGICWNGLKGLLAQLGLHLA
jgi:multiple antibiotic resistance protein